MNISNFLNEMNVFGHQKCFYSASINGFKCYNYDQQEVLYYSIDGTLIISKKCQDMEYCKEANLFFVNTNDNWTIMTLDGKLLTNECFSAVKYDKHFKLLLVNKHIKRNTKYKYKEIEIKYDEEYYQKGYLSLDGKLFANMFFDEIKYSEEFEMFEVSITHANPPIKGFITLDGKLFSNNLFTKISYDPRIKMFFVSTYKSNHNENLLYWQAGYITLDGKIVSDMFYDDAKYEESSQMIYITQNNKRNYMTLAGKYVLNNFYDSVVYHSDINMFHITQDLNNQAYITPNNTLQLAKTFYRILYLRKYNLFWFIDHDLKEGFLTLDNKLYTSTVYDKLIKLDDAENVWNQDIIIAKIKGKFCLINLFNENASKHLYDEISLINHTQKTGKLFSVSKDNKKGIITKDGNILGNKLFDSIQLDRMCDLIKISENEKIGYMTLNGTIISAQLYDDAKYDVWKKLIKIKKEGKIGYMTKEGILLSNKYYDYIEYINDYQLYKVIDNGQVKWMTSNGTILK